jgi:hypothetical protein
LKPLEVPAEGPDHSRANRHGEHPGIGSEHLGGLFHARMETLKRFIPDRRKLQKLTLVVEDHEGNMHSIDTGAIAGERPLPHMPGFLDLFKKDGTKITVSVAAFAAGVAGIGLIYKATHRHKK